MDGINKHELTTHIDRSERETSPFDRRGQYNLPSGEASGRSVETNSRNTPERNNRDDRNFSQSLWGRR